MKFRPFKVAAVLLVVFCALHTAGGMLGQESLGPDSDGVFASMKAVHFTFNGSDSTWYGFWFGFGLMVSAFLAMSAVVAWKLEGVPSEVWPHVSVIAWALVAAMVASAVLGFRYFFVGPGVFSVLAAVLMAYGTWVRQSAPSPLAGRGPG